MKPSATAMRCVEELDARLMLKESDTYCPLDPMKKKEIASLLDDEMGLTEIRDTLKKRVITHMSGCDCAACEIHEDIINIIG